MRNPATTPSSIIFGILILGFLFFVLTGLIFPEKSDMLQQMRAQELWGNAFLRFMDVFPALLCSGAMIAYSLFIQTYRHPNHQRVFKAVFKDIISVLVLVLLFFILRETLEPGVRKNLQEKAELSRFSTALFNESRKREREGNLVEAVNYMRLALDTNRTNPEKITEHARLLALLDDNQYLRYKAMTVPIETLKEFDTGELLRRAQSAFDQGNYILAYFLGKQVLENDSTNSRALRITAVALERDYRSISARTESQAGELARTIQAGYRLLTDKFPDYIRAYYLFLDLYNKNPNEESVKKYLSEARSKLPLVSFYTQEAQFILSFDEIKKRNIVFFNFQIPADSKEPVRELISIRELVRIVDGVFMRDIEVIGFLPGNRIQYHYNVPVGKVIGGFININGINPDNAADRIKPAVYQGTPSLDPTAGIKLSINPDDLEMFAISQESYKYENTGNLWRLAGVMQEHAQVQDLITVEILIRMLEPLFIFAIVLFFSILGIRNQVTYATDRGRVLYLFIPLFPLVLSVFTGFLMYSHRMASVFLYYSMGPVFGIGAAVLLNIGLIGLSLILYTRKHFTS
ncbi:MAG: hypothetical protein EHM28_01325 [Spirochaetaceae bacterium]|nr:MAG: hypothetical protein EHM28_01325 [Spirochaetaceae bacterium]